MISAPQTKAAITAASVNALMPPISSQRSWSLAGPFSTRNASARRTMSCTAMPSSASGFGEARGQKDRKRHFVQLGAGPARPAAKPLVLRPMPVRELRRHQVAQDLAGMVGPANPEESTRALHEVPWPDEVITPDVARGVAPGDAEARHHAAAIGLVVVREQYHRGDVHQVAELGWAAGRINCFGVPAFPGPDMAVPCGVERLQQRRDGERRRRLTVAAEPKREHHLAPAEFAEQCDVSRPGLHIGPGHGAVGREVLPAVANANKAGTGARPRIALGGRIGGGKGNGIRTLFRAQYLAVTVHEHFGHAMRAVAFKMRREQRVKFEVGIAGQSRFDQQNVAHEVGGDPQAKLEAWMLVQNLDGRDAGSRRRDVVIGIPLDLDPEAVAVGDDKSEIPDLRHVDARVVHLVDDAIADRHPQPGWPDGRPDQVFGAARPRGTDAWAAGRRHGTGPLRRARAR